MLDLTFGEQVKLILSRRGMTIKELAETIEIRTGKKMSRQNLTQRLGRDNFQEQDMRMIAEILDCPFQLSILGEDGVTTEKIQNCPAEPVYEKEPEAAAEEAAAEPEYTIEEPENCRAGIYRRAGVRRGAGRNAGERYYHRGTGGYSRRA